MSQLLESEPRQCFSEGSGARSAPPADAARPSVGAILSLSPRAISLFSRLAPWAPPRRERLPVLLLAAMFALPSLSNLSRADDLSTSSLPIDGLPTLAAAVPALGTPNAVAEIDPSTGALRTAIVFQLPAARGAAQPALQLVYNSSAGTGVAGPGWSFSRPSVEREGAAGFPKFVDDASGSFIPSRCGN